MRVSTRGNILSFPRNFLDWASGGNLRQVLIPSPGQGLRRSWTTTSLTIWLDVMFPPDFLKMELGEITDEISTNGFAILFESNLRITCDTSILEINLYSLWT